MNGATLYLMWYFELFSNYSANKLAEYLLELSAIDYRFVAVYSHYQGAAAVALTNLFDGVMDAWV